MPRALILFAHGSRDARWAEPFARVRAMVEQQAGEVLVRQAFLEMMQPDLASAVQEVAGLGATEVTVVPLFLGQGGHVRRDLPAIIDALRAAHPGVQLRSVTAAGEDEGVLAAIASYCLQQDRRAQ